MFKNQKILIGDCREKLKDAEDRVTTLVKDGVELKEKSGIVST